MSWSSLLAARVITSGGRLQSEAGTERGEVGASSAEGTPGYSPHIWSDEQSPQSKEKGSLGQSPVCQEAVLLQGPRVPSLPLPSALALRHSDQNPCSLWLCQGRWLIPRAEPSYSLSELCGLSQKQPVYPWEEGWFSLSTDILETAWLHKQQQTSQSWPGLQLTEDF